MSRLLTPATTRARSTAQWLLRWFTWPLALSIASAAAWVLIRDPEQAVVMQMATMLTAVLLVVLAERVLPLRRDWQRGSRAEVRTDLTSMVVLMAADPIVKRGLLPLVATGGVSIVARMGVSVAAVFQHANADLRYDGWNWVFSTADLHRWHHATGQQSCQANFGGLLTLWDLVFGTYRRADGMPKAVGVDAGVPQAAGYIAAMHEAMHNARVRQAG